MRIVLIRPCCLGDVVLATAALMALRRAYPDAHINWAVGRWSQQIVREHPALDDILDTGQRDLPVRHPLDFAQFVMKLRRGHYDLAVSLVRSRLMTLAVGLSGIAQSAGIDSAGRGSGYTVRASIDPQEPRHEAEIYLDVVAALGIDTGGILPQIPVQRADAAALQRELHQQRVSERYFVVNPAGGSNPGMTMHHKRWPVANFAQLADALSDELNATPVLLGGPADAPLIQRLSEGLHTPHACFTGVLSFGQIGALAAGALLYIGNDTGLTHLAAASGGRTAMILGPTDPRRYGPVGVQTLALWKPVDLKAGGVAMSKGQGWDWARDGISTATALAEIRDFMARTNP